MARQPRPHFPQTGGSLVADLRKGCAAFREQLVAGRLATLEELTPYWPGGSQNPYAGPAKRPTLRQWIRCYTVYGGFARRVEWREVKRDQAGLGTREMLLDAVGEVPETVELLGTDPATGQRRRLTVYQKSDLALKEVHKANGDLAFCIEQYEAARKRDTIEGWDAAKRWLDELTYLHRLIVWIVTTPGPGIPYAEGDLCPALPPDYDTLSPVDFHGLLQAFQRVNILPLTVLESSVTPKGRADWAVFFAGMEFETGTPAPRLRRDRGLAGLVVTAHERARGQREAMDAAATAAGRPPRPPGA